MADKLYVVGLNTAGQLGFGDTTARTVLTLAAGDWLKVSSSGAHTLGIKTDGTLWAWGTNTWGQLGLGDNSNRLSPVQVGSDTWIDIAASKNAGTASFGIKSDGSLWACGRGTANQLGIGDYENYNTFQHIAAPTLFNKVVAGYVCAMAISTGGKLFGWGTSGSGVGLTTGLSEVSTPTQVGSSDWLEVDGGTLFMYAIRSDGTLWRSGDNANGMLSTGGFGNLNGVTQYGADTTWTKVACGYSHVLALKADGSLWSCGENSFGNLGHGNTTLLTTLTHVGSDSWTEIAAGFQSGSAAINADGTLYAFGNNANRALGLPTATSYLSPTQVDPALVFDRINVGTYNTFAITTDAAAPPAEPFNFWENVVGASQV